MQDNNEYVKPIDSHSDEMEDNDWVNATHVKHITSSSLTGSEDLKGGEKFESKVKLLQAITE